MIMDFGAELREEWEIEQGILRIRAEEQADKGLWTTRDGDILSVHNMSDSHIENCLKMLKRSSNIELTEPFIIMFEKEQTARLKSAWC